MKIVFAGTPHFADTALRALLAADAAQGFTVVGVFTQPDRPSGRGLKLSPSPVKHTALTHGIPVFQPLSLRLDGKHPDDAAAAQAALHALAPDVMVVAAYGLILPQWALDLPTAGCINIHASLLPRWRGAAPIQRAIEAGDAASGVCLMRMALGLDTGPVFAQESTAITQATTGGGLHDDLARLGAQLLCAHLPSIVAGSLPAIAQDERGVTYAHKLQRTDGLLDWRKTAAQLANQVRAYDPTPGCAFEHGGQTYKVWAAQAVPAAGAAAGTACARPAALGSVLAISAAGVDIACGEAVLDPANPAGAGGTGSSSASLGVLRITEIQKAGGKRLPVSACWQHLGLTAA